MQGMIYDYFNDASKDGKVLGKGGKVSKSGRASSMEHPDAVKQKERKRSFFNIKSFF